MKKHNLYALVAAGLLAGGMSITSASAADLGGNCCADLEERIAELEATTARKGNRKVSLTVSGWVGQQVTFWDDGVESNTYVHDLGTTLGSHVKFTGSAQISPGWSAGYVLQIEAIGSDDSLTHEPGSSRTVRLYDYFAVHRHRRRADAAVVLVRQERPPRQGRRRYAVAGFRQHRHPR